MTFHEILTRTRELAQDGVSWRDAWNIILPDFERLAAAWTSQERLRNFQALLAAHTSDDFMPVEPVGTVAFSASKDHTSFANEYAETT